MSTFLCSSSTICIKVQYFNLNRILLLAIGLWPYQKSKFVLLQEILLFSILLSFVIFQFTALITTKCTLDVFLNIFSNVISFSFYVINYNMFWINMHHVKNLLERIQYIYDEVKDENEIAIITKYGNFAKRLTAMFIWYAVCNGCIAVLLPFWPQIFGTVLHINKSRLQTMHIVTESFVDGKKNSYLSLFHTSATLCIGTITLIATGTLLLGLCIHVCGMFKIASYRIEQAMTTKMLENINLKTTIIIYKKIFYAVEIHRNAMKFIDSFVSSFEGSFLSLIILGVICLSINIFAIYYNASHGSKEAFLLHLIFVIVLLLYMFVANYVGQEIINYCNHTYTTAYNVQWYKAPLYAQKMILVILIRGNKIFGLNIAGLFLLSLECFAMLTKASMSYFTFIYTTQQ